MRHHITVIIIFTFLTFNLSTAQKNKVNTKVPTAQEVISSPKISLSESEAYKLLYENAKENNDRILTTIHSMIGLSIGFLLTILGTQIFFNWRINKKEIDYIKKDIDEKITELKSSLIKDLALTNKDQEEKTNKFFEKQEKDFLNRINIELDKTKNLLDIRDELTNLKISSVKNESSNEIKALKINVEKNEGDLWKIKGVESNALSSYLRTALLQIELGREVKYILDDIISILENLKEIHAFDNDKLDKLTGELKDSHQGQKEKIIALYISKPVYQYSPQQNRIGIGSSFPLKTYIKNEPS
jgi:hypothetical protein